MSEPLLLQALACRNTGRPPVWFMRQAGRYHRHYQALRRRHEFIDLCRIPALATEVTMGPIEEFGFDAAILFSDLLFPLEAMGMGLRYAPGPQLDWHLRTTGDLAKLSGGASRAGHMEFQARALELLRARLPASTGLIGFVGGPFTLYAYAVAGSHEGFARTGLDGLDDGLYQGFNERLVELLAANMALQAEAGAACVAIFDTAAGTLTPAQFARHAAGPLKAVVREFRARCPHTPVIYYSRDTGPAHWAALADIDLQCLGIDWRHDLVQVLQSQDGRRSVQGNIDPHWLLLPPAELEPRLQALFDRLLQQPAALRAGWVCGLGHGVLQTTPESNIKLALRLQREMFGVTSALADGLIAKYDVPGPRYTSYPTVPYWDHTPDQGSWLSHVAQALEAAGGRHGASLYVHIPFCRSLCTFCGCNTRITRSHSVVMPYLNSVLAELDMYLQALGRPRLELDELHLGGGTPTYLDESELDALLTGLAARAPLAAGAPGSVEVDPRVTGLEQLIVLARHGFRRLSIGVQDFDPRVQAIVNREQSESCVAEVARAARTLGFGSINFDLIYGLPLQTEASIEATMDAVGRLRPDRIALYGYAHVPWIKAGQRRFSESDVPQADERRALYERGRERLEQAGYREVGLDHFALETDALWQAQQAGTLHRNFMGYTDRATLPLIGLGVSAIGDAGGALVQNEKDLRQYQQRIEAGALPIHRGQVLDHEDLVLRGHILRLMTRFETRWDTPAEYTPFLAEIHQRLAEPAADGLVELAGNACRVTPLGRAFLRNLCMAFDARLARQSPARALFSRAL